jgi:hypothetical protein
MIEDILVGGLALKPLFWLALPVVFPRLEEREIVPQIASALSSGFS